MNPRTGVITLQQPLSYEDSPTLSMIIQVEDGGGREDSAQFILRVEPVNSDGPQFSQDLYNTQVREQESRLSPPIRVNVSLHCSIMSLTFVGTLTLIFVHH